MIQGFEVISSQGHKKYYSGQECNVINAKRSVKTSDFYGKYICGLKGGANFTTAIRPDYDTDVCPDGTVLCSVQTDAETTICAASLDSCPITEMIVVPHNYRSDYETYDYQIQDINNLMSLVTSKNSSNSLPITTTKVSI